MKKVCSTSMDIVNENIKKLGCLFPEVIKENKVDFNILKSILGNLNEKEEIYSFTWNGKEESTKIADMSTTGTLIPCPEKSIDWDNTNNVYIEGDNLEVLKILQKSYYKKIKMIYIDPPYNTSGDFIYNDSFKDPLQNYKEQTNQKYKANSETNGRFHTKWLNMIYPRLRLAKNLLSDDGIIFISIDENEVTNLRKVCDELFGEINFISNITRVSKTTSFRGNFFAPSKDYILCYAKNINNLSHFVDEVTNDDQFKKVEHDGERKGEYYRDDIAFYLTTLETRPNQRYYIECPDGELVIPPGGTMPQEEKDGSKVLPNKGDGVWRWEQSQYLLKKNLLVFKKTKKSPLLNQYGKQAKWNIYTKSYLNDKKDKGNIPRDIFEGFLNRNGSEELARLDIPFSFPKPTKLIKYLAKIIQMDKESYVLDFFSGSATTADAIMQMNAEDEGNRKYIMIQLPEIISDESIKDYKTICDIGEERIRRAGKKIKEETKAKIDYGFKVFKLDTSNIKVWNSEDLTIDNANKYFYEHIDPIVEGRTNDDILYEILLKEGITLSSQIKEKNINTKKIYHLEDEKMVVCLQDEIDVGLVKEIGKLNPTIIIFKDSGFKDENAKVNALQELKKIGIDEEKIKSI